MSMFCYQCEQTAGGVGCKVRGVCGKNEDVAALQDLLLYAARCISAYAHCARRCGAKDAAVDRFVVEALFSTVTNVDFDPDRLVGLVRTAQKHRDTARRLCEASCKTAGKTCGVPAFAADWRPAADVNGMIAQGRDAAITRRLDQLGPDLTSLQEILTYGLKGAAAYADHARILGREDDAVYAAFHEYLDALNDPKPTVDGLLGLCLKTGALNLKVMELLDAAHTSAFGNPVPTAVRVTPVKGKAIVVSGHDLRDLELLLQQTAGKGINIYTHGEMLPAHGYPGLKKYPHLVGNYGGAWQDQVAEFDAFPGAVLMTTNCIQKPKESYRGRIFTTGLVAMPGVRHVADKDFTPVIQAALEAPGFAQDAPERTILVGFGHAAVMSVAGKVVEAVKSGAVRRFFLIGGCDGAKPGRNYYSELADRVPKDCVILTLACGKYRFNKKSFGDIGGIPRLLDIGQCNDAYSAIQIAVALSKAFNCGVNDLPLSIILSWYEQKAVAILLTLLHLGIRNMRIGPSLPAFVSPAVLNVLVEKFKLTPITTPEADLKAIMG